jgi:hypothetical protein
MPGKTSTNQKSLFLQLFIKELILNSVRLNSIPETITREISREREIPPDPVRKTKLSELTAPEFSLEEKPSEEAYETSVKIERPLPIPRNRKIRGPKKPISKHVPIMRTKRKFTAPLQTQKNIPHLPTPKPSSGHEVNLGKLNPLIDDKEVTIIECPGPDRFVLVKKAGKVNLTKIKLSKSDINKIITNFSEKARIPLIEGVFKAIVGNFSISAVIADSIGNKFLIYKKTPYSIIDQ